MIAGKIITYQDDPEGVAAAADAINEKLREVRKLNGTPLLCRSKVRQCLLDAAKQHRPFNKFIRVSEDTLCLANEAVRRWLVDHVKRMPSKGRTL